jgi:hypothetical protein
MQSGLLPVSTTLYQVCAEIDLMGSMIISAAGKGARGAKAFKRGTDTNVPDSADEALVLVGRDQEIANIGWPASHAKDAMDVVNQFARHVAEAHQVPGFLVVADQTAEVPSGVALEMMMVPLTRNRLQRIALNRTSVARRYAIERAIVNGAVGTTAIPWEDVETWHPGQVTWPRDPMVSLAVWEKRIAMGEADLADVVQDMRSFASREEALTWLGEVNKERAKVDALKPLPAAAAGKLSLAQRLGGGALPPNGIAPHGQGQKV